MPASLELAIAVSLVDAAETHAPEASAATPSITLPGCCAAASATRRFERDPSPTART